MKRQKIKEFLNEKEEKDAGHGRIEKRTCYISSNLSFVDIEKWKDAKPVVMVVSDGYKKKKQSRKIRQYVTIYHCR